MYPNKGLQESNRRLLQDAFSTDLIEFSSQEEVPQVKRQNQADSG
jgi:hypothetical protein